MAGKSVQRLEAIGKIVGGLKDAYPDAKRLSINIEFEWQEPSDANLDSELCPIVKIDIER